MMCFLVMGFLIIFFLCGFGDGFVCVCVCDVLVLACFSFFICVLFAGFVFLKASSIYSVERFIWDRSWQECIVTHKPGKG